MIHPRFRTLVRYVDNELSSTHRARVAAHVLNCGRCHGVIDEIGVLLEGARRVPHDLVPPPGLLDRDTDDRTLDVRFTRPTIRFRFVVAAATLAVGLVGLNIWLSNTSEVSPDQVSGGCMSREMSVFPAAASILVAAACAQEPTAPPPAVVSDVLMADALRPGEWHYEAARWTDGVLRVVRQTISHGLERVEVRGTMAWRIVGSSEWVEPRRAGGVDTTWLSDQLRPMRQILSSRRAPVMDLTFTGDSAVGFFGSINRRRTLALRLPPHDGHFLPSYSFAAFTQVLRAVPLTPDWAGTFWTVTAGREPIKQVALVVTGEGRVTVPAGSFDAWRLQVLGRSNERIWVSKDERLLVKTSSGPPGDELETVLVSYVER